MAILRCFATTSPTFLSVQTSDVEAYSGTARDGTADEHGKTMSTQLSRFDAGLPSIVVTPPAEDDLPSYRVSLETPIPRRGPSVMITPPRGSLLPPIQIQYRLPAEEAASVFPTPAQNRIMPVEAPEKPKRRLRSYFWPPPNGDDSHPDSLLSMPVFRVPIRKSNDKSGMPSQSESSSGSFWFIPATRELPSIRSVLAKGEKKSVRLE